MNDIQESNRTFQEIWTMYARGIGGEVVEQSGVLATWAGVQWPILNMIFLSAPIANLSDLKSTLETVAAYTGQKKQFGMLIACDSWLPATSEQTAGLFGEYGWVQVSEATGMICEQLKSDSSVKDLEYRRVDSRELRQAVADINAGGYGVPGEMAREALDREELWGEGCFGYVGYFNGNPVTTSTTYVRDGYLYVALVATLPDFRSRHFAAAITSHSINEAGRASNLNRVILHSTPMARSIYELLGFRPVTTFPMFLPHALVAAEPHT
ncbi:MAG TPA: GNAT family N-acetyltransferase [Pyrinomonadaceae bacterium]